jgi:hypothetical protein
MEKIILSEKDWLDLCDTVKPAIGRKPFKVSLSSKLDDNDIRSNQQNKYLWGVVYNEMLKYFKDNPREFLEYLLQVGLNKDFIHEYCKRKYKVNSTAFLDTRKFFDYVENIKHDCYHDLGFRIPNPNEDQLMQAYEQYLKIIAR